MFVRTHASEKIHWAQPLGKIFLRVIKIIPQKVSKSSQALTVFFAIFTIDSKSMQPAFTSTFISSYNLVITYIDSETDDKCQLAAISSHILNIKTLDQEKKRKKLQTRCSRGCFTKTSVIAFINSLID